MKPLAVAGTILGAVTVIGCSASSAPVVPQPPAPAPIRLAQCEGPAMSLPDSLARKLPPRTGRMIPDDRWADLANTVPGGFAGFYYDSTHTPILLLTDPSQAAAAKQALASEPGLLVQQATVRQARWNFAQLVDWFNYLTPRIGVPAMGDKDEMTNRVHYNVTSVEIRDRLISNLAGLPLPCDLIIVDATLGGFFMTAAHP